MAYTTAFTDPLLSSTTYNPSILPTTTSSTGTYGSTYIPTLPLSTQGYVEPFGRQQQQVPTTTTTRTEEVIPKPKNGAALGVIIFAVIVLVGIGIFLLLWFLVPRETVSSSSTSLSSNLTSLVTGPNAMYGQNQYTGHGAVYEATSPTTGSFELLTDDTTGSTSNPNNTTMVDSGSSAVGQLDFVPESEFGKRGPNYTDTVRYSQFSFNVTDEILSCILSDIASQSINIEGSNFVKSSCKSFDQQQQVCTTARLIPATNGRQSTRDITSIQRIINDYKINFNLKQVVAVKLPNLPGQLSRIQEILFCRVTINDVYKMVSGRNVYDTSNVNRTEAILNSAAKMRTCKKTCYSNGRNRLPSNPC